MGNTQWTPLEVKWGQTFPISQHAVNQLFPVLQLITFKFKLKTAEIVYTDYGHNQTQSQSGCAFDKVRG